MIELPDHVASALIDEWPAEAVATLRDEFFRKGLHVHGGPLGILRWIYAGAERPEGRVPYRYHSWEYWRYLVEDTRARLAVRRTPADVQLTLTDGVAP